MPDPRRAYQEDPDLCCCCHSRAEHGGDHGEGACSNGAGLDRACGCAGFCRPTLWLQVIDGFFAGDVCGVDADSIPDHVGLQPTEIENMGVVWFLAWAPIEELVPDWWENASLYASSGIGTGTIGDPVLYSLAKPERDWTGYERFLEIGPGEVNEADE